MKPAISGLAFCIFAITLGVSAQTRRAPARSPISGTGTATISRLSHAMPSLSRLAAHTATDARPGVVQRSFHLTLILRKHVSTDDRRFFQVSAAVEIGCVIDVTGAVVDSRLRVRAEWTRTGNGTARGVLSKDLSGRHSILCSVHQRVEQVLWLWPCAPSLRR